MSAPVQAHYGIYRTPSFPAPIYATLIEADQPNPFNLVWSRRNGD